jgi:topoisomerase-4 subunit A
MQHEKIPVGVYTEKAYRNYANYVILNRAIPRLEDGLKPVQRRIIYAMSELGLQAGSKPKKSARTIGDVMGKYHPHGDSACYEAMVLMAQSFSYRYTYVLGQGNWGAIDDPKSFASMRYTEANLSIHAKLLLEDLNAHTTDWGPNFDGTLKEPLVMPATLPTLLLNGTSGIAVGIATDIPPFNLKEVAKSCIALLRKPTLSIDELLTILPGPDYPTGAEIINSPLELKSILETGWGQIKQRGVLVKEENQLIIKALPFQTSTTKIIQQIANLMIAKKLPTVKNIRDESDEDDPIAIVLILKSNRTKEDDILPILFSETDLEKTQKVNITYISPENKPVQNGVLSVLQQWLIFREKSYLRQLNYALDCDQLRLNIINGLLVVFDNIDEVVRIVRFEDTPLEVLQKTFSLSEIQAAAILEIKLKRLGKLELPKLELEKQTLLDSIAYLQELINNPKSRKKEMISKIERLIKTYGDSRRTTLVERKPSQKISISQQIPKEPCLIVLSKKGWVRITKSHECDLSTLSFKSGDELSTTAIGYTDNPTLLFDDAGVAYSLPTHSLASIRSQGEPITKYIASPKGLSPYMINGKPDAQIILVSNLGYGFISNIGALSSRNKAGKKVFSLQDTSIATISEIPNCSHIALISQQGRLLIISLDEVPKLAKGKGNKLIQIRKQDLVDKIDKLSFIIPVDKDQSLVLSAGKRSFKLTFSDRDAYCAPRGKRGTLLPRGFRRITDTAVL